MTSVGLALLAGWGFSPGTTLAQSAPAPAASAASADIDPPATTLAPVTRTSTRTERATDAVPSTITVVPARAIETRGARDLKDLFRHEVDLSVRAQPSRFGAAGAATGRAGNEGLNIRGLEGNQVLMLVDGIRVPASFSFGPLSTGRADFLALDATQALDVLRGPASTAFGSDGLAGAISLRTVEPEDLLRPGLTRGGFVRLTGDRVDDSLALTSAAAIRRGPWQALLLLSRRDGHETRNQGDSAVGDSRRTAPNPVDYEQNVLLGKLRLQATPAHRIGATVEALQRRIVTEVLSGRTPPPVAPATPAATSVVDLDARDRIERARLSLEHRFEDLNAPWVQRAETHLYVQDATTRQFADEDRLGAADRTREGRYGESVVGLSAQFETNLGGSLPQRLSYGLDISRTRVTALRDGTPNPSGPPPFGETFPVKPFPDTDYLLAGAFVQSEIEVPDMPGRLTLIPGLRLDHFALDPSSAGYAAGPVVKLADQALSPRLGAVWSLGGAFMPYAQLARGYRAPAPAQVNNGFTNVAAGYQSIGNPDLRPETAQSLELGVRGRHGALRWQLAAYSNRYRDFISQEVVRGTGSPADPLIFQHVNLAQARIHGAEARAELRLGDAWTISAAAAAARGTSERSGVREPLDSIDPARLTVGLHYERGAWQWRVDLLHAEGKATEDIRSTTPAAFAPPGYTVLDLGLRWRASTHWSLVANVRNAGNVKHWRWSDVRGLPDTSAVKDAYTAPGRTLQLALRHDF